MMNKFVYKMVDAI